MTPTIGRITGTGPEDFGLDEIVADGVGLHIERMSRAAFWMNISAGDRNVTVWFEAKKNTLYARVEDSP